MEQQDIYALRILDEMERESEITQRRLASRLQISLGLVNSFMKRLARKGYFKVTTFPPRRVRYLLTPKGLAEKSRLTMQYLDYSLGYYRDVRAALAQQVRALRSEGIHSVCLVGCGELAELAYLSLREHGVAVEAVGKAPDDHKEQFLGKPLLPWPQLGQVPCQAYVIAETTGRARARASLLAAGAPAAAIRDLAPESLA